MQVNKLLDEIGSIAGGREIIFGGDFNLTVSHWSQLSLNFGKSRSSST